MDDFKQAGTAEWDQRQAFHKRLHEAIILAHNSLIEENYNNWFKALSILYTELYSHIDEKMEDEHNLKASMLKLGEILTSKVRMRNNHSLLMLFSETQRKLHIVMRIKGFDVPIKKARDGSVLESEGSY